MIEYPVARKPLGYTIPSWDPGVKHAVIGSSEPVPCAACGEPSEFFVDNVAGWLGPCCGLFSTYIENGTGNEIEIPRLAPEREIELAEWTRPANLFERIADRIRHEIAVRRLR